MPQAPGNAFAKGAQGLTWVPLGLQAHIFRRTHSLGLERYEINQRKSICNAVSDLEHHCRQENHVGRDRLCLLQRQGKWHGPFKDSLGLLRAVSTALTSPKCGPTLPKVSSALLALRPLRGKRTHAKNTGGVKYGTQALKQSGSSLQGKVQENRDGGTNKNQTRIPAHMQSKS